MNIRLYNSLCVIVFNIPTIVLGPVFLIFNPHIGYWANSEYFAQLANIALVLICCALIFCHYYVGAGLIGIVPVIFVTVLAKIPIEHWEFYLAPAFFIFFYLFAFKWRKQESSGQKGKNAG